MSSATSRGIIYLEAPAMMRWCASCLAGLEMPLQDALLIAQTLVRECILEGGSTALERLLDDFDDIQSGRVLSNARPEHVEQASNHFWVDSRGCQEVLTLRAGIELATMAAVWEGWAIAEMSAGRHAAAIRVFLDSRALEGMAGFALMSHDHVESSRVTLAVPQPNRKAWLADLSALHFMNVAWSLPTGKRSPTLGEIAQQIFAECAPAHEALHDRKTGVLRVYLTKIEDAAAVDLVERFAALADPSAARCIDEDGRYSDCTLAVSEAFLEEASIWSSRLGVPQLSSRT